MTIFAPAIGPGGALALLFQTIASVTRPPANQPSTMRCTLAGRFQFKITPVIIEPPPSLRRLPVAGCGGSCGRAGLSAQSLGPSQSSAERLTRNRSRGTT
ncbi:MAG: hypothetical protein IPG64_19665 [Haliea sp.]|nr:hypothetical protein [Haliea sp.]